MSFFFAPPSKVHRCIREFVKPAESLAKTLDSARGGGKPMKRPNYSEQDVREAEEEESTEDTTGQQSAPEDDQEKGMIRFWGFLVVGGGFALDKQQFHIVKCIIVMWYHNF